MKYLAAILALLLAGQSYGVYGAAQADRIMYTCTLEAGPLCFAWELNVLGEFLGEDKVFDLEDQLEAAKKKLDADFIENIVSASKDDGKSGLKGLLKSASEVASDALEKAKKAADKAIDKLE